MYLGSDIAKYSSPNILLFLTYNSSDGIYFGQESIDVNVVQLVDGVSLYKEIVLDPGSVLRIRYPKIIKKVRLSNASTQGIDTYSNGLSLPLDPPTSMPYEGNPEYFAWIKVDSDKWPSSGYGKIPLAWINASSRSYGYISCSIILSSAIKFNIGYAMGVYSSSVIYKAGANVWSTYAVFGDTFVVYPGDGGAGYIYIYGRVEGALYQLTYRTFDEIIYYDEYQYDVAIIDVQVDSQGHIIGGNDYGPPPQISQINDAFTEYYYTSELGTGSSQPQYTVYSIDFVNTVAAGDTTWINIGIPVGSILVWALGSSVAIPTSILVNIAASISSTSLSISLEYAGYDAFNDYTVYLYAKVGAEEYIFSNGLTGQVPLMGIRLYAYPNYPEGPH